MNIVLIGFMGLTADQVMLAYNKFNIPPNEEIFIALSYLSPSKAIANWSWMRRRSLSPKFSLASFTRR